ncbi:hypothetical protein CDD81_3155 [Ophiocordyceps australis]|uniref:Ribosome recycling factor domain-containing protein n=1 Tax=Ophiocordyceps australis TaxID=1399860 RepID=A0A2C5XEA6_9HYPO|nr:hypothetical protein CDD81_3155 [Ophiocordyceps australis]
MVSSLAIGVLRRNLQSWALTRRVDRFYLPLAMTLIQRSLVRPFSESSPWLKKRKVLAPLANHGSTDDEAAEKSPTAVEMATEALDPDYVRKLFSRVGERFSQEMQTTVKGGRFNPTALGAMRVCLAEQQQAVPLSQLAEVVPRPSGRIVSLLLHSELYIRPVMSAVQNSKQYNQQPQRVEDNELELVLKVEPERKEDVVRRVKQVAQAWRDEVRKARHGHEKQIKEWRRQQVLLSDDVRRGDKMMQKVQDKTMKEIDAHEAKCIKQLER